ncbi:MAG: Wzz/FepE/Etk N-terminal domain-containing protein [Balneolaceae bacterium]
MSKEEKEYRLIPFTEDDDTDRLKLSDLFITTWKDRKVILIITAVFAVYGIFVSLATSEEFTSTSSMMPNMEQGSRLSGAFQQFSGLLGNVGIDPGSMSSEIDAGLYPEIIYSTPAMYNLIYSEIYSPDLDSTLTVKDYMLEHRQTSTLVKITGGLLRYTVHLPLTIASKTYGFFTSLLTGGEQQREQTTASTLQDNEVSGASNISMRRLSIEEYNFIRDMKEKINVERNRDTGLFMVGVSMPEPEISAQVTQSVVNYLTHYITEYRTEKLVRNLEFINASYSDAEEEFVRVQNALTDFRDRNQNISTARLLAEEQRLQSEYQLKFDLLNSIAQKREETRINLEEETPVFNILEPVSIPTGRSKPARAMMTVTYTAFGFLAALFWVYLRHTILRKKE